MNCPLCQSKTVERTNKKTKEKFVGCSMWPKCTWTEKKIPIDFYNSEDDFDRLFEEAFNFDLGDRI